MLAADHWLTAYNEETIEQNLASEFSTNLAETLLNPSQTPLSSMLRNRLLTEATQAATTRRNMLTVLDAEATQLDTVVDDLEPIVDELRAVEHGDEPFAKRIQQLDSAHHAPEELVHTHQSYLHERQTTSDAVFTEMVYAELETPYPGLSALATTRSILGRIELRLWASLI